MKNITSPFITRTRLLAVLTVTCFALGFTGVQAGDNKSAIGDNSNGERSILISWNLDFTSDTTADGTSTIAGAFSDEGARHEDFTVNVQGNRAIVTGTIVIHGSQGDINEQFVGTIPLGPNPTLIEGTGVFTGGTGAYAGVTGRGTFEGTIDFATGKLVGVTEGRVRIGH
jgi:hypothetical protein